MDEFVDGVDHAAAIVDGAAKLAAGYFVGMLLRSQVDDGFGVADADATLGAEEVEFEIDQCSLGDFDVGADAVGEVEIG